MCLYLSCVRSQPPEVYYLSKEASRSNTCWLNLTRKTALSFLCGIPGTTFPPCFVYSPSSTSTLCAVTRAQNPAPSKGIRS